MNLSAARRTGPDVNAAGRYGTRRSFTPPQRQAQSIDIRRGAPPSWSTRRPPGASGIWRCASSPGARPWDPCVAEKLADRGHFVVIYGASGTR